MGEGAVRNLMQAVLKQEHVHSGLLMGGNAPVSLISSSNDEKATTARYAHLALPLMLVAPGPKK